MVETRIAPRYRVSKAGTIESIGGRAINCMVRNLSVTGAAIEVSDQTGIPEGFALDRADTLVDGHQRLANRSSTHYQKRRY